MQAKQQVILICVDLSKPFDKNKVSQWFSNMDQSGTRAVIVGTKSDIADPATSAALRELCSELECPYVECSAITGKNVQAVFDKAKNPVLEVQAAHLPSQSWTQKKTLSVTINGLETLLENIEKNGKTIKSFKEIFADRKFASSSSTTYDPKQGVEKLTANMVDSKTRIEVEIRPATSKAGREVEISTNNPDVDGKMIKEVAKVVERTLVKCGALPDRSKPSASKAASVQTSSSSNPMANVTISTSCKEAKWEKPLNRAIEMAGVKKENFAAESAQESPDDRKQDSPSTGKF